MSESEAVENMSASTQDNIIDIADSGAQNDVGITADAPSIDFENLKMRGMEILQQIIGWAQSPKFYAQLGIIFTAIIVAFFLSKILGRYLHAPSRPPQAGSIGKLRELLFKLKGVLFPLFLLLLLGISVEVVNSLVQQSWLVRIAQSLAVVGFIYAIISYFIESEVVKKFVKWGGYSDSDHARIWLAG